MNENINKLIEEYEKLKRKLKVRLEKLKHECAKCKKHYERTGKDGKCLCGVQKEIDEIIEILYGE